MQSLGTHLSALILGWNVLPLMMLNVCVTKWGIDFAVLIKLWHLLTKALVEGNINFAVLLKWWRLLTKAWVEGNLLSEAVTMY